MLKHGLLFREKLFPAPAVLSSADCWSLNQNDQDLVHLGPLNGYNDQVVGILGGNAFTSPADSEAPFRCISVVLAS